MLHGFLPFIFVSRSENWSNKYSYLKIMKLINDLCTYDSRSLRTNIQLSCVFLYAKTFSDKI